MKKKKVAAVVAAAAVVGAGIWYLWHRISSDKDLLRDDDREDYE